MWCEHKSSTANAWAAKPTPRTQLKMSATFASDTMSFEITANAITATGLHKKWLNTNNKFVRNSAVAFAMIAKPRTHVAERRRMLHATY